MDKTSHITTTYDMLYLGMADDIWTVLSMKIDSDIVNLHVIDMFDEAFTGGETLEDQRDEIRTMITSGNNHCIRDRKVDANLPHKGQIISDIVTDSKWSLDFQYGLTTIRACVHTRDFMQEWPEEIRNIDLVLYIGAASWENFLEPTFLQMMTSRTVPNFDLIALTFLHEHFPTQYEVIDRYGNAEELARLRITRLADGSLDMSHILDPRYLDGTWGVDKYGDFVPIELVNDPEHNSRPTVEEIMSGDAVICDECGDEIDRDDNDIIALRTGYIYCSPGCLRTSGIESDE